MERSSAIKLWGSMIRSTGFLSGFFNRSMSLLVTSFNFLLKLCHGQRRVKSVVEPIQSVIHVSYLLAARHHTTNQCEKPRKYLHDSRSFGRFKVLI